MNTLEMLKEAKEAAVSVASYQEEQKNAALLRMAEALIRHTPEILAANKEDMDAAREIFSAKKLLMGTPTTMPPDTPILIFATAFGARVGPTRAAATVKAMEQ